MGAIFGNSPGWKWRPKHATLRFIHKWRLIKTFKLKELKEISIENKLWQFKIISAKYGFKNQCNIHQIAIKLQRINQICGEIWLETVDVKIFNFNQNFFGILITMISEIQFMNEPEAKPSKAILCRLGFCVRPLYPH